MPEGKRYRSVNFPPRLNYSLEALRESNEEHHAMLLRIMEIMAVEELGIEPEVAKNHDNYSAYIISTGLIKPYFEEEEEYWYIYFKMWSFFQKKYVDAEQLEEFEIYFLEYFFSRMFDVN
jgi:hypothetical protein